MTPPTPRSGHPHSGSQPSPKCQTPPGLSPELQTPYEGSRLDIPSTLQTQPGSSLISTSQAQRALSLPSSKLSCKLFPPFSFSNHSFGLFLNFSSSTLTEGFINSTSKDVQHLPPSLLPFQIKSSHPSLDSHHPSLGQLSTSCSSLQFTSSKTSSGWFPQN